MITTNSTLELMVTLKWTKSLNRSSPTVSGWLLVHLMSADYCCRLFTPTSERAKRRDTDGRDGFEGTRHPYPTHHHAERWLYHLSEEWTQGFLFLSSKHSSGVNQVGLV